jgi:DNA adenine methylase
MNAIVKPINDPLPPRPLMKWAGGKTQLLPLLSAAAPLQYGRYIEPFIGGGALFFHLRPKRAVVADSNSELVSMYRAVAADPNAVFSAQKEMKNTEDFFYELRAVDWRTLTPAKAAARMLFLNRTCFNGLYRVNRDGQFNVPFGRYTKLSLPSLLQLHAASKALKTAKIIEGDYLDVLGRYAKPGDFVFLDPPYLPVGVYSDFKRYTKVQFSEDDHRKLAIEVRRLAVLACHVLLTNSNHPIVHELYEGFNIQVIQTKRFINSKGNGRTGEDVLISSRAGHTA